MFVVTPQIRSCFFLAPAFDSPILTRVVLLCKPRAQRYKELLLTPGNAWVGLNMRDPAKLVDFRLGSFQNQPKELSPKKTPTSQIHLFVCCQPKRQGPATPSNPVQARQVNGAGGLSRFDCRLLASDVHPLQVSCNSVGGVVCCRVAAKSNREALLFLRCEEANFECWPWCNFGPLFT